jgi:hypothetical protein
LNRFIIASYRLLSLQRCEQDTATGEISAD